MLSKRKFTLSLLCLSAALLLPLTLAAAPAKSPVANEQAQKLTTVLQSSADQKAKADACRELARIADKNAIAALAALLPDEALSHMARYALETIPDPEVDKVFRSALETLHGRPLVGVIGSIGVRRDPKAVKPLSTLLADADSDTAQAAARALGKIGNSAAANALEKALPNAAAGNQVAFCEGLLRCAEKLATDGKRKQAIVIYDSLRSSPAGHQVRTAALRGSILARGKDGLPLLIDSLGSADYAVFAAAARASIELPGEPATKALAAELSKPSADRQILLTQTLAQRKDPAALPALMSAAQSGAQPVRIAAIRAVSESGHSSAVSLLTELMNANEREIAQAAQEALAALPGKEADAAVLAMLRGSDITRRATAMDLVARRRMSSALPDLYTAACGSDAKFRVNAIRRIAEVADSSQTPEMLGLLSKASGPEDLEAIEQALGTIALKAPNRDTSAQTLAAALGAAQPAQKCALLRVLGSVGGPRALKAVRAAVTDPAPEVRTTAIRTLGAWNSVDAAPDLLDLARNAADPKDKVLSLRSYLGLASQQDLPADARLGMCRQAASLVQTPEESKLLLSAVATVRSPESFSLILPHLETPSTSEEAAVACLTLAGKLLEGKDAAKNAVSVIEPLQKLAQAKPDSDTAKKAQNLLEKAQGMKR